MRRDVAIEILVPTEGLHYEATPSVIKTRSSPNLRANAYYGVVQKEYGASLFATGTLAAPCNLLFEANFTDSTILEGFTHTGMYKHSGSAWVADSKAYSGTFSNFWSACMHNDDMIFANGVDLVQGKLSAAATGTDLGSVVDDSYKAHAVVSFKEHLCLYNVTEAGNASPKRVRWSKVGTLAYTAADFTTGTASFLDVPDIDTEIINAVPMGGGVVIVYGRGTIHLQEWVGGTSVFNFTKMIENIEIPSPRCIISNDAVHYVLTRDNVYEYKGGRSFTPIGTPIRNNYLTIVNQDYLSTAFLDYIREDDELHVWVPTTGTQPDTCYICKVRENYSWFRVDRAATAAGKSKASSAITIGELVGNLGAQTYKFGDLVGTTNKPIYLTVEEAGFVAQRDITRFSTIVAGTAAAGSFVFDTKALSSINDIDPIVRNKYNLSKFKDNETRWLKATIEARGYGSMSVSYSVDEGNAWTAFPESPKTLASEWDMYEFDCDITAPTFMVRVANSAKDEYVNLEYIKVEFSPGADSV